TRRQIGPAAAAPAGAERQPTSAEKASTISCHCDRPAPGEESNEKVMAKAVNAAPASVTVSATHRARDVASPARRIPLRSAATSWSAEVIWSAALRRLFSAGGDSCS